MKNSASRAAPRLFTPVDLTLGVEIRLPDRAAHHVSVLRLRRGDSIILFNGQGGEFTAELARVSAGQAWARVLTGRSPVRESPLSVALAQCISSGDRMDTTLQKSTELGVSRIIPIASERSVVKLSGDRAARRLAHWRNVVIAACEQCGRNQVPEVASITDIEAFLDAHDPGGQRLLLAPEAGQTLRQLPRAQKVALLVGPEGGLTDRERAHAERAGYVPLRFGPRVLRTETAPLAAIAAMQTLWGDC
ncbi:MAG TPA: 16S rRNA (uracil(1498)-N(3))-methyltransferase [Burkholderiales bacterium]|nr:16S rRNA (uracil(1498)-N(3))-methyltransferase [Burkholderiales bacterium]